MSRIISKTSSITSWSASGGKHHIERSYRVKFFYMTVNNKCYRITSQGSVEVPALQCHQEEADGQLLLHAVHAARECEAVVICSEDTDVFIMCLAFHDKVGAPLFQKCEKKPGEELLISRKLLLLLVLMSAEPSLACMHTLAVIQSVLLQAKGK